MAVLSVKLRKRSMNATEGKRSAIDEYQVVVGAVTDDPNVVRTAVDPNTNLAVPQRGDPYSPNDAGLLCKTVDIQQEHEVDFQAYIVTCTFETGSGTTPTETENPLDIPPRVRWGHIGQNEQIYLDRNGEPIVNSAGQPFDPSIEDEIFDLLAIIQGNNAGFDPLFASQYMNAINSDSFSIRGQQVAPGVAKVIQFDADEATMNGIDYFAVTIGLRFRVDEEGGNTGWIRKILDNGTMALDADGIPRSIKDSDGTVITDPVFLNGQGLRLPSNGTPVFLNVDIRKLLPFAPLNLP